MAERTRDPELLSVEWWPLERPIPYARNARVCPESAIAKVAGSIKEFGFKNPILVDGEGVIIAGHTRLLAAQRLGIKVVPVVVAADLSPAQVKAYRLADNRTAQETSWDYEMLEFEMADLEALDYDVSLTGFDAEELLDLKGDAAGLIVEDEAPEPPDDPITKPGDLWLLGEHRVLCGDATDGGAMALLMDGKTAGCVLTDPPYGMALDTNYAPLKGAKGSLLHGKATGKTYRPVIGDDAPFDAAPLCAFFDGVGEQFWFGADYYRRTIPAPDEGGSWLVWDKRSEETDTVIGAGFELLWSKAKHKRDLLRFYWCGALGDAEARNRVHPTQKPSKLLAEILTRWSPADCIVADPFLGSGTTLIAAEQTGRICYGMEIDPRYCDVAVLRWEAFTGAEATLEGDGRTFADVAEQRSE